MRVILVLSCVAIMAGTPAVAQTRAVPVVGCPSDGQTGPLPAPKTDDHAPKLSMPIAARLAWYASNHTGGVLAPRGWHCFEDYGSNGSVLIVAPHPVTFGAMELTGPAIQRSVSIGDTSGRFEAARVAARLFPARRAFVDEVIAEDIEPRSQFVFGPFPADRVKRLTRDVVAFETPAGADGMGTMTRLVKSGDPIQGLASMDDDNSATLLAVRLGPGQRDLAEAIVGAMALH